VVFFAVGFETTAPATAFAVEQAQQSGLTNFSILAAHVLVPPAMSAILANRDRRIQGFLAAGHVCTIMGYGEYEPIAKRYQIPIVVTGFEPLDILQGVYMCVQQLEQGRAEVENQYRRSVRAAGNKAAITLTAKLFQVVDRQWRGIGTIPDSGLDLRPEYAQFDAIQKFGDRLNNPVASSADSVCISGEILQGIKKPHECEAFGDRCTPEHPLGAPMVSSEGACAAYYRYRQQLLNSPASVK
jgi:hydrogenase expression/formation protein HypD